MAFEVPFARANHASLVTLTAGYPEILPMVGVEIVSVFLSVHFGVKCFLLSYLLRFLVLVKAKPFSFFKEPIFSAAFSRFGAKHLPDFSLLASIVRGIRSARTVCFHRIALRISTEFPRHERLQNLRAKALLPRMTPRGG